jgi:putative ABC transport system substrate-binding protein
MDRRRFASLVALGCAGAPLLSVAQRVAKVPRIGFLSYPSFETPQVQALVEAARQGLREHGYLEGKNTVIEYRSAAGKTEDLPRVVRELVALEVDVIVMGAGRLARVARQVTTTIPIVAAALGDPVEEGLAASLARPGGNVTGLTILSAELIPKRLSLLKELLPRASRITGLWQLRQFGGETTKEMLADAEATAQANGMQLQLVAMGDSTELDGAFAAIAQKRPDALFMFTSAALFFVRQRVVDLAAKYRLPAMYYEREFPATGGLISYGPSLADSFRRTASYVDRILKGSKPGELPIEQPTKFELAINLRAAKALGIAIPQSLLVRADEVIQ